MSELDFTDWIGRHESRTGCVAPAQAAQIHATLGSADDAAPEAGEAMPPLWHWCAFVPTVPLDELGRDGHPRLGGFLPPVPSSGGCGRVPICGFTGPCMSARR